MKNMFAAGLAGLLVWGVPMMTEGAGGGGGGGGSQLDFPYGDLVVIDRDENGVPILNEDGCAQPLDIDSVPIPLDDECEVSEDDEGLLVEVDFGRLSIARSPSYVLERHFGEAINAINNAERVRLDPAGRLQLKYLVDDPLTQEIVEEDVVWKTIDSPLENLALYVRLMTYGHLQTDPDAVYDAPGRQSEETMPSLSDDAGDLLRAARMDYLLSNDIEDFEPQSLDRRDLLRASAFLAGAADKSGRFTADMVVYLNSILGINGKDGDTYFNFNQVRYNRGSVFNKETNVLVLKPRPDCLDRSYYIPERASLLTWLLFTDDLPRDIQSRNLAGFLQAANDSLQVIVFIHNFAIPEPKRSFKGFRE